MATSKHNCDQVLVWKDIEQTLLDMENVEREIDTVKKRYQEAMDLLSLKKSVVQKKCSHRLTTTYPDPAGGSDRWTVCDICGVEVHL
jgi:cell fate (sporulation/competence/biofilm development) regulator YmcA (YheA/YmcA/DUF963 family)